MVFEFPKLVVLKKETRSNSNGQQTGSQCTISDCCYQGK